MIAEYAAFFVTYSYQELRGETDSKERYSSFFIPISKIKKLLQPFAVPIPSLDTINSCVQPRRHIMEELAPSFLGFP